MHPGARSDVPRMAGMSAAVDELPGWESLSPELRECWSSFSDYI